MFLVCVACMNHGVLLLSVLEMYSEEIICINSTIHSSVHPEVINKGNRTCAYSYFVVVQSLKVVSDSLQPYKLQLARLPCPSLSPGVCLHSCSLSQWCHPTISPSVALSPPALNLSQHQGLSQWIGSLHQVVKVLELQHQSFQWIFSYFTQ